MMLPSPAWRNRAACHRPNRTFYPYPGVDVHDDRAHQHERAERMQQGAEADQRNRKVEREILPPDNDSGQQETGQASDDREEQEFLSRVVTADLWQAFFAIIHDVLDFPQPDPVALLQIVVAPQFRGQKDKGGYHET